jgi:lipopolysaccharide transport system ATP-binding protein
VAAYLQSDIVIVDEVLAVGDSEFQNKCLGRMNEISRAGRIVIFVSHNLASITRLCSRAILLESGRIVDDGAPVSVVSKYMSRVNDGGEDGGYRSLRQIPGRVGDGRARFLSIRTTNLDGQTTATFACGEPFNVQVEVDNRGVDRPLVGFGVVAADGTTVLGSQAREGMVDGNRGLSIVQCRVDPNVLMPGRYHISCAVVVAVGGVDCDYVEHALNFEIMNTPYSRRFELPVYPAGYVHVPYDWTLVTDASQSPELETAMPVGLRKA